MMRVLFIAIALIGAALPARANDATIWQTQARAERIKTYVDAQRGLRHLGVPDRIEPQLAQLGGFLFQGPTGPLYVGPGDIITSGWTYWVGFRAFNNATKGTKAMRLCLHSTPATCQDINTTLTGDFDTASAATFCTSACDVAGGYDKSGNSLDLIQATTASRPAYATSCINTTLPCATLNGSQTMTSAGGITGTTTQSLTAVAMQTATPGGANVVAGDNGSAAKLEFANAGLVRAFCGSGGTNVSETDNVWHDLIGICAPGTNATSLTLDGVTTTDTETPANANGFSATVGGWIGKVAESGYLANGTVLNGTQITALCHNQRIYWGTGGSC